MLGETRAQSEHRAEALEQTVLKHIDDTSNALFANVGRLVGVLGHNRAALIAADLIYINYRSLGCS